MLGPLTFSSMISLSCWDDGHAREKSRVWSTAVWAFYLLLVVLVTGVVSAQRAQIGQPRDD